MPGIGDAWHRRCLASEMLGIGEATASFITLGGIAKICLLKKIQIKIAPHNAKFSGILHFVQNDRWEGRMTKGGYPPFGNNHDQNWNTLKREFVKG